eukprot:s408_g15.t2
MKMDVSDAPSPCPPIECTHRRHVQRLQMFLEEVKEDPAALEVEVADRRMDEFGAETGMGCPETPDASQLKSREPWRSSGWWVDSGPPRRPPAIAGLHKVRPRCRFEHSPASLGTQVSWLLVEMC